MYVLMRSALAVFVMGVRVAATAQAQAVPAGRLPLVSGRNFTLNGFAMYTEGRPFRLTETITSNHVMPDGQQVTSVSTVRAFRDAQGRFRLESGEMRNGTFVPRRITLFDPVALTEVIFSPQGKTAELIHVKPRELPTADDDARAAEQQARSEAFRRAHPGNGSVESLGTHVFLGETTQGVRRVMVFSPSGPAPFTRTSETWTSADLNIAMLDQSDDPVAGARTAEVTELERVEPDPELFKVPAGMKLVERVVPQTQPN